MEPPDSDSRSDDLARIAAALERVADALVLRALEAAAASEGGLTGERRRLAEAVYARLAEHR